MPRVIPTVFLFCYVISAFALAEVPTNVSRAIDEFLLNMREPQTRWDAQQGLQSLCDALGDLELVSQREEAEKFLIVAVKDTKNQPSREWIVRMLGRFGSGACAPVLGELLKSSDGTLFDETVATLSRIQDQQAGQVLSEAISKMSFFDETDKCVAIFSALGYRAQQEGLESLFPIIEKLDAELAVGVLQEDHWVIPPQLQETYANSTEKLQLERKKKIWLAAIDALGKIGSAETIERLRTMRLSALTSTRMFFGPSLIQNAFKMAYTDQEQGALSLFQSLQFSSEYPGVRCGAMNGMLHVANTPDDLQFFLFFLGRAEQDRSVREVCLGFLWNFEGQIGRLIGPGLSEEEKESGKGYTEQQQIERFQRFSPEIQAALLEICGEKRDETALPLVRYGMKSEEKILQAAAYGALARIETQERETVPFLLQKLAEETNSPQPGPVEQAIVQGLRRTLLENADEQIADAVKNASSVRLKNALLEIAQARRLRFYLPLFLLALSDDNPTTRDIAATGYGEIAQFTDLREIVNAILRSTSGEKRDVLERVALKICERNPDKSERTASIINLYEKADEKNRDALLGLLGRLGGSEAYQVVLKAMREGSPTAKEAAFHSLCQWPDTNAMDELYRLASRLANRQLAAEALRGYIRILSLPSRRTPEETVTLFEKAMQQAETPELQNEILQRIAVIRSPETLRFVVPYIDESEHQNTVFSTVLELAEDRTFHDAHREVLEPLLEKILRNAATKDMAEQARRLLDQSSLL